MNAMTHANVTPAYAHSFRSANPATAARWPPPAWRCQARSDPANTFHEKGILCRAAENTCYVATVNCASDGTPTTSAVARPDGTLMTYQPYGQRGLLIADIDLAAATGLLAGRFTPSVWGVAARESPYGLYLEG